MGEVVKACLDVLGQRGASGRFCGGGVFGGGAMKVPP